MRSDTSHIRCYGKVAHDRSAAIEEATRLGYPVAPYKCPNGRDHWHVGGSTKNAKLFHNQRTRWDKQSRNQED